LDEKEESAAASFTLTFRKPSPNDLAALALAKSRGATLLTGDAPLREAAATEGVTVHGVLWLLDMLVAKAAITPEIAAAALDAILADGSRLPDHECRQRLRAWGR
jgi:predicted nucleic acid-binding protein